MNFKIVGIGELLWDLLPAGRQLGGAPANFAFHAHELGAVTQLVTRVGNDVLGRETLNQLTTLGVPAACVEIDPQIATGTVGVEVSSDGQPQYQIHENVAWDFLRGETAGRNAVAHADAVCFGTLAQRSEPSRSTIQDLVASTPPIALRIFDINLRQHYYCRDVIERSLALANVLKVNDAEMPVLREMFNLPGDIQAQIEALTDRYSLRAVAYTRGGGGSLLFAGAQWSDHPGIATNVVDTVGAGDSFTAAMTLGLLAGWELDRINDHANRIAAFVCSQAGATPRLTDPLRQLFRS